MTAESKLQSFNRLMTMRDSLACSEVERLGDLIDQRILSMEEFRTSLRVGLYASRGNEVRTDAIFTESDIRRKEIYYPAVDDEAGTLEYFRIKSLDELVLDDRGVREPSSKQSKLRDLNTLNVLVVPGVAFDLAGNRMGIGKGYFGKCLSNFSGKRIGLAYEFQVIQELPRGIQSGRVDWVVTENRIIKCRS